MQTGSLLSTLTKSSVAAGPVFVTSTAVASLYLDLPRPIDLPPQSVIFFLFALLPATLFGFPPAFFLSLIGARAMTIAEERVGTTLPAEAWLVAGAASGAGIASAVGANAEIAFGLVTTSLVCAWICRKGAPVH